MVERSREQMQYWNSLLDKFAADPAVQAFVEPGVPEVERRSYRLQEELLPSGEVVPPVRAPGALFAISSETFARYRGALFAISGLLSVVHSLLHNEIMRTPCGGTAWNTLSEISRKMEEVSEALSRESAAVAEREGEVE